MGFNIAWSVDSGELGKELYRIIPINLGDCRGNPANILIYSFDYITYSWSYGGIRIYEIGRTNLLYRSLVMQYHL